MEEVKTILSMVLAIIPELFYMRFFKPFKNEVFVRKSGFFKMNRYNDLLRFCIYVTYLTSAWITEPL